MKIEAKSNFGNFAFGVVADVSNEVRDSLAAAGLLQIIQRSPASAAEKEMAGFEKRPEGFKRTDIPFSDEAAEILRKHLASVDVEIGRNGDGKAVTKPIASDVTVTEYVPSEGAAPKFTEERKTYAGKGGDKARLQALATKVGYDGNLGDGTAENAPESFLRAMRDWKRAALND